MERKSDSRFRIQDFFYDNLYGIETKGYIHLNNKEGYKNYLPTKYFALKKLFRYLKVNKEDYFVDFGCGLGRVTFYASIAGCGKVLGLDINPIMYEAAQKNLKNFQLKTKKNNIVLEMADATKKKITEKMNIFYFFTPFSGEYFKCVIENIVQSKQKNSRKITIITCNTRKEYKNCLESINLAKRSYVVKSIDGFFFDVYIFE